MSPLGLVSSLIIIGFIVLLISTYILIVKSSSTFEDTSTVMVVFKAIGFFLLYTVFVFWGYFFITYSIYRAILFLVAKATDLQKPDDHCIISSLEVRDNINPGREYPTNHPGEISYNFFTYHPPYHRFIDKYFVFGTSEGWFCVSDIPLSHLHFLQNYLQKTKAKLYVSHNFTVEESYVVFKVKHPKGVFKITSPVTLNSCSFVDKGIEGGDI